jgi:threonine dehydrogenase-like Zn-dependent dehydrogenase
LPTAEFVRVPNADDSLIIIPSSASKLPDKEFLFISDIWATGWTNLDFAGFQAGDTVAVFGCGPMGLLCIYSAILRGASRVYAVDHVKARLDKAREIGAIPIDFTSSKGSASEQILKLEPDGVRRSCDCCGYECINDNLKEQENFIISEMVKVTGTNGGMGVAGVYFAEPDSKGTPRGSTKNPNISFPMTTWWEKGLSMRGGAVDDKTVAPILLELVLSGRARPGFIVSGEFGIDEAPEAYRRFDRKLETKALLTFPWRKEEGEEDGQRERKGAEHANGVQHENGDFTGGRWAKRARRSAVGAA